MDRKLTTILAADLAGYSRMMALDEEGVIERLRTARKTVIDPAISGGGGRIIKTMGDGLLMEFPSPVRAVRTALRVLREMRIQEAHAPQAQRLRFRVGINLGDVVIDGDDVLGDAVNIAARLESLAPVGGLCISRNVFDQANGRVDAKMTALGPQAVKNLPKPVEVWRVEVEGAERPKSAVKRAERPSIAVLPFSNMSSDPDQEFLADGIVEDVTTELSRFRSLMVIARNSTFAYKGKAVDIRRVGEELGARYVVEGSVRRGGNRLRVTAQLIEASTGAHVWADRWDRMLDDLFALQDELTEAIVTAVEPELGAHERRLARARPTESLTSWELCQRGWSSLADYTPKGLADAEVLLKQSAEADPHFALPRALLARLNYVRVAAGFDRSGQSVRDGLNWARDALRIDDRFEIAHGVHGVLLGITGQAKDAAESTSMATALNPNNAFCHHSVGLSEMFSTAPDTQKMITAGRTALRLSPKDPIAHAYQNIVTVGLLLQRYSHSDPEFQASARATTRLPGAPWYAHLMTAVAEIADGDMAAARRCVETVMEMEPDMTFARYRTSFPFPYAESLFELGDRNGASTRLIELGMPPG